MALDEQQKKCLIKYDKPHCKLSQKNSLLKSLPKKFSFLYFPLYEGNLESNKSSQVKPTSKRFSSAIKRNFILNHFSSNWLWKEIKLDAKGQKTLNFNVFDLKVPSWLLTAFSLTKNGLNLVGKDIELYMIKPIQMKLRYPRQCIIGEHISVQINVVNYLSNPVELLINIELNDQFNFLNLNSHQQAMSGDQQLPFNLRLQRNLHEDVFLVNAEQTSTINFAIEPKRVGFLQVKFTARTSSSTETLMAEIDVKENAYHSYYVKNIILDLNSQQNLIQYIQPNTFNSKLANSLTYQSLNFHLFGDCLNHLLPVKQLSVAGRSVNQLRDQSVDRSSNRKYSTTQPSQAQQPNHDFKHSLTRIADENVFNFSRYLFTIIYANKFKVKNLNTKLLFRQLDLELQSILSFQNPDGGFRRFKLSNSPSSVKSTAFVLKMFTLANQLDYPYGGSVKYVEQSIIDRAALFLINYQTNQGVFKENSILENNQKKLNFSYINSNENNLSNEIELTTSVLIALGQVETAVSERKMKIDFVKKKSLKYLNSILEIVNGQDDLYTLSILTYCLNLFKTVKAKTAYSYLGAKLQNKNAFYFWAKTKDGDSDDKQGDDLKVNPMSLIEQSRNLQATAYGLLTQVLCNGFIKKAIVNWLNSNLQSHGDYLPVYDTILATEAILAYLIGELEQREHQANYLKDGQFDRHLKEPPFDAASFFNVEIENQKENAKLTLALKDDQMIALNSTPVRNNKDNWMVKASGSGFGILQVRLNYALSWTNFIGNQVQMPNSLSEQLFSVRVNYFLSGTNYSNLKLEICLKNELKLRNRPIMLKFRLPTSFHVSQNQLNSMVQDRIIANLKEATFLAEDTVIFIFDKVASLITD